MAEYYATPSTQAVGIPRYYGNWDTEFWVIAPTPDKTYEITLAYNKEPVSITDTTQSYNCFQQLQTELICQTNIKIYFCMVVW